MTSNYWEGVPTWGDGEKRFEVMADDNSGRIPVTKVERWQDFAEILEDPFFNQNGTQLVFRGHRRFDWGLLPTLGRLTENGIIDDDLAKEQLALFRMAVRGRLKDTSLVEEGQEDELWSIGQYHGLMTPLLDWTYSPYVGLFFAFSKEDQVGEEDNPYRVVYVLNKTFVDGDGHCPDIRVVEPRKDDHGRLVNQAGLFTFSPTDATIENKLIETISEFEEFKEAGEETEAGFLAQYICKIYIRNDGREDCLKALRRMNVHHASLFPDLLGASDYCNILMEEQQNAHAIAEAAQEAAKASSVKLDIEELPSVIPAEMPEPGAFDSLRVAQLLTMPPESEQVEPGRIQLIANQLVKEMNKHKHKVVDWSNRYSAQAKLRNVARVILRKNGYPPGAREYMVEQIFEVVAEEFDMSED